MRVGDIDKKHAYGKYAFDVIGENKKTFKEVVMDIKEGEVWVTDLTWDIKEIKMIDGYLYIDRNNKATYPLAIREECRFELKREKYTFEEAFKYYEKDEENSIESCESGEKYNQLYEDDKCNIPMREIRGLWFIDKLK